MGFILFFAAYPPTNVKRLLRHPQLTGVALWGVGHLLANGESRSIVLFGGLTLWAIAEIVVINRRDGARDKPAPVPAKTPRLRCALLLSLITERSVSGQSGARPRRPGAITGSSVAVISTARQTCVEAVAVSVHS